MRVLFVIPLLLLLSGCIPFFSFFPNWGWLAADGASYVTTGKSTKDHALSYALDQDCAMYRVIQGKKICIKTNEELAQVMFEMPCDSFEFDSLGEPYCNSN